MHSQIGAAVFQRNFKLFHKQALATDLAQSAVQNLVTQSGHAQQADLMAMLPQARLNVLGLPQGKTAFSCCYSQIAHTLWFNLATSLYS